MFEVDTSTYYYKSRRPGQVTLESRIREICHHGQNKTRRIYRELGLQLRNKTPKRRVKAKPRSDRRAATRSNETWAMDFVHDQLATGRTSRSNWAKDKRTFRVKRPIDVVVLNYWVTETMDTP